MARVGAAVLVRAGASREAALGFIVASAQAAQRTLVHDDADGLDWLYQIEAQAKVWLAREQERDD